jgi:hypothetical protein
MMAVYTHHEMVNAKRVQTIALATSALLLPVFSLGNKLLWSSIFLATLFAVVLYASLLASLISSLVSHRSDHQSPLASWRLTAYKVGLTVLLMFCVLPLATWAIALSGTTLHLRFPILCLLGVNAGAAILVWFGSGWSRLGLTVVAFWVSFLSVFPLALRD